MNSPASNNSGNIVVGVDGSPTGEHAVRWAAEEARLQHRGLTLVHARKPLSANRLASFSAAGISPHEVTNQEEQEADQILQRARGLAEDRLVDTGVETMLHRGDPRGVLLDLADSSAMEVVGSRGHGTVLGLLLGSVSGALVRHATCPIAVVRPTGEGGSGVLVGADGSEASLAPLEVAYDEASTRGAPLTVVHCLWDVLTDRARWSRVDATEPDIQEVRLRIAESLAGLAEKYPDVPVEVVVARGSVDACLVDLSQQCDLLVIGRPPRSLGARLVFHGMSTSIAEHAHSPVIVVP